MKAQRNLEKSDWKKSGLKWVKPEMRYEWQTFVCGYASQGRRRDTHAPNCKVMMMIATYRFISLRINWSHSLLYICHTSKPYTRVHREINLRYVTGDEDLPPVPEWEQASWDETKERGVPEAESGAAVVRQEYYKPQTQGPGEASREGNLPWTLEGCSVVCLVQKVLAAPCLTLFLSFRVCFYLYCFLIIHLILFLSFNVSFYLYCFVIIHHTLFLAFHVCFYLYCFIIIHHTLFLSFLVFFYLYCFLIIHFVSLFCMFLPVGLSLLGLVFHCLCASLCSNFYPCHSTNMFFSATVVHYIIKEKYKRDRGRK